MKEVVMMMDAKQELRQLKMKRLELADGKRKRKLRAQIRKLDAEIADLSVELVLARMRGEL